MSPGGCGSVMVQGLPVTNEVTKDLNPGFLSLSLSYDHPRRALCQTGLKTLS